MIQLMEHFQRSCNSIGFFELIYDISVKKSWTLLVYTLVDIESFFFTIFLFYFLFVNSRRKFTFRIFFGLRFPYNLSSELTRELLEIDST